MIAFPNPEKDPTTPNHLERPLNWASSAPVARRLTKAPMALPVFPEGKTWRREGCLRPSSWARRSTESVFDRETSRAARFDQGLGAELPVESLLERVKRRDPDRKAHHVSDTTAAAIDPARSRSLLECGSTSATWAEFLRLASP